MKKEKLIGLLLMAVIVTVVAIIGWWQVGEWKHSSKTWEMKADELDKAKTEAETKAEALAKKVKEMEAKAKAEEAKAKAEARAKVLKLATIGRGEGIEHALIRQLIADPTTFGFEGDACDKKVKTWAQKRAHQIAILAGYVNNKTGEEIRVKGRGGNVAYVLIAEGDEISVEEYTIDQDTGNFNPEPEQTNQLADSYSNAQFAGSSPDNLQPYEYIHV